MVVESMAAVAMEESTGAEMEGRVVAKTVVVVAVAEMAAVMMVRAALAAVEREVMGMEASLVEVGAS